MAAKSIKEAIVRGLDIELTSLEINSIAGELRDIFAHQVQIWRRADLTDEQRNLLIDFFNHMFSDVPAFKMTAISQHVFGARSGT